MDIRIVGRPKSKAVTRIVENSSLGRYHKDCEVVVNYGLAGDKLDTFSKKHPTFQRKPIINKYIGCSKYKAIKEAKASGIKVPKTFMSLPIKFPVEGFLTKKLHSQGGIGIIKAINRAQIPGKYYQEFIKNRRYELRVHGFLWLDKKDWLIQKRFGREGEIAWNFHNGGRFQSIKNPNSFDLFNQSKDITAKILGLRNMSFGAVDFIVTASGELYFLEVNSAPGFTELSEWAYIKAFDSLKLLTKTKLLSFCN